MYINGFDLKSYCDTKLVSNESIHFNNATPNRGSYVANSNTEAINATDLSLNTSLFVQLNAKLDRMDACFNLIRNACITSTSRNDHLSELESNLDKLQKYKNSASINRSYADAKIFPKALAINRFPVGIYSDPKYKLDFATLLGKFQLEILNLNHQHILDNIKELENKVSSTLDIIKMYDDKFDSKYKILQKQSEDKLKTSFKISNEKSQSLLIAKNSPPKATVTQDDNIIVLDSSTSRQTHSKSAVLPQRVNKKHIQHTSSIRPDNRHNQRSNAQSSSFNSSTNFYSPLPRNQQPLLVRPQFNSFQSNPYQASHNSQYFSNYPTRSQSNSQPIGQSTYKPLSSQANIT